MIHALRHALHHRRPRSTHGAGWYLLALAAITACQDRSEPSTAPDLTPSLMASVVTGPAAANLDAAGRFQLPGPLATGLRQISRKDAESLAVLWPKQFGPWIQTILEREHRGIIDLAALAVCGRTLYAESPFEPFDPLITADPVAMVSQRVFGPWWLITLCGASGDPQISLGVSAYATDLTIVDGRISGPRIGGEWFSAQGIPAGATEDVVIGPERAAERVASKTGRRIREVPRLVIPFRRNGFPNLAYWSLTLEAGATVGTPGKAQRQESEFYFGKRPGDRSSTLSVAALNQPDEIPFQYVRNVRLGQPVQPPQFGTIHLRRRPAMPILFEPVTNLPAR